MSTQREINFLNTMIGILKYDNDDYPNFQELLTILRNSKLRFVQTTIFARLYNQCYENVELRIPVSILKEAKKFKNDFEKLIHSIYEEDENYALGDLDIKVKITDSNIEEIKQHEAHFEKIKDEILQSIRNARYTIWIAVTWFTDNDIFLELKQKKDAGLNIRIILSEETSNHEMIEKLKREKFDIKIISRFGYNDWNRIHGKYCIIDLEYVLHGSYNWTPTASHNEETLATALDKDFVIKFSNNFLELYNWV